MKRLLLLLLLLIPLTAEAGPQGRGEPCAKDSDCGSMLACRNLSCRSVEDLKCRASDWCKTYGWCTSKPESKRTTPPPGSWLAQFRDECWATTDADCRASERCKREGACSLISHGCWATNDPDCRASEICKKWGKCTARGHTIEGDGFFGFCVE